MVCFGPLGLALALSELEKVRTRDVLLIEYLRVDRLRLPERRVRGSGEAKGLGRKVDVVTDVAARAKRVPSHIGFIKAPAALALAGAALAIALAAHRHAFKPGQRAAA